MPTFKDGSFYSVYISIIGRLFNIIFNMANDYKTSKHTGIYYVDHYYYFLLSNKHGLN